MLGEVPGSAFAHPRFEIVRTLGRGGFGTVFEAWDRERGMTVALKSLRAIKESSLVRFKEEFRRLSRLHHDHLPALYELFFAGERPFFTMELVPGVPFTHFVRARVVEAGSTTTGSVHAFDDEPASTSGERPTGHSRPRLIDALEESRLRRVLFELVEVVRWLHAERLVHCDIKPGNVLVREDGRLFLLDFGGVRLARAGANSRFVGTPAYAAPEQLAREAVGPEADWYAVGTMLYECLLGERPFRGGGIQVAIDKLRGSAPPLPPGLPADLASWCEACLAREPSARRFFEGPRAVVAAVRSTHEPCFVGRETELASLERAFAESRDRLVVAHVEGPSAIGKTSLVRHFLERSGARVFAGRASEKEHVPFNALDAAVDGIAAFSRHRAEDVVALEELFPVFRGDSVAPSVRAPSGTTEHAHSDERRERAIEELVRLLSVIATEERVALWIDDIQWADQDSRALLRDLLARAIHVPLLIVLGERASKSGSALPLPQSTSRVVVGPLDDPSVRALAGALAKAPLTASAEDEIVRAANGLPLFVEELSRAKADQNLPRSLDHAILARVGELNPEARRLLRLVCVSTVPVPEAALARAAAITPALVARHAESLQGERFVRVEERHGRRGLFAFHDRVRETVSRSLSEDERRELHRALASALEEGDERDVGACVVHLSAAGERDRAAALAERAATRAERLFAFEQAAELLGVALSAERSTPEHEEALYVRLANCHERALFNHDAATTWMVLATRSPGRRTAALERAARLFLSNGDLDEGMHALRELLAEYGEKIPETQAAALLGVLAERIAETLLARGPRGLVRSPPIAPDVAEARFRAMHGAGEGLGMIDNVRGAYFQARALRFAHTVGDRALRAEAMGLAAIFRGSAGARARKKGRALVAKARALFPDREVAPRAEAWLSAAEAILEMQEAPSPRVEVRLAAAEERFARLNDGQAYAQSSLRLMRGLTMRLYGDLRGMRVLVPALLRDAERRNDRYERTTAERGAFCLACADDRAAEASKRLDALDWPNQPGALHFQEWLDIEARFELDLYEGRAARALRERGRDLRRIELASFNFLVQCVRILVRGLAARICLAAAAAASPGSFARHRLVAAASVRAHLLLGEGTGYAAVRGKLLLAGVRALAGDEVRSLSLLREARELASKHEMDTFAAVARCLLAAGDPNERASGALGEATLQLHGVRVIPRYVAAQAPGFGAWLER